MHAFSVVARISTDHSSYLAKDTITALLSVNANSCKFTALRVIPGRTSQSKDGGSRFRSIQQHGDNQCALHVDRGSYADAVFAKSDLDRRLMTEAALAVIHQCNRRRMICGRLWNWAGLVHRARTHP